jgi:hypothetical protein
VCWLLGATQVLREGRGCDDLLIVRPSLCSNSLLKRLAQHSRATAAAR